MCSSKLFQHFFFLTDRELELRELRKTVLSSQEENISLNKEMEQLKVCNLQSCVFPFVNISSVAF